jgi:hypothetical protein
MGARTDMLLAFPQGKHSVKKQADAPQGPEGILLFSSRAESANAAAFGWIFPP